jgi:hypothetical protein
MHSALDLMKITKELSEIFQAIKLTANYVKNICVSRHTQGKNARRFMRSMRSINGILDRKYNLILTLHMLFPISMRNEKSARK